MDEKKRRLLEQIRRELAKRGVVATEEQIRDLALREQGEVPGAATPLQDPTTCGCASKA